MDSLQYRANGKLLLTGEYFILDGAEGIALPCSFGQKLSFSIVENNCLEWESHNLSGLWFQAKFNPENLEILETNSVDTATTLQKILRLAAATNEDIILKDRKIVTQLEFPNNWGLGSSSTLIVLISKLFACNPFVLQFEVFGGSAYDIACGIVNHPIIYSVLERQPSITKIDFDKPFLNDLYFIHLNQKQNSRSAIKSYRSKPVTEKNKLVKKITALSKKIEETTDKKKFIKLLHQHEDLVGNYIEIQPVQSRLFPDFDGQIKSLGAWGGDFVMAVSNLPRAETIQYFKEKQYPTILKYEEMILQPIF